MKKFGLFSFLFVLFFISVTNAISLISPASGGVSDPEIHFSWNVNDVENIGSMTTRVYQSGNIVWETSDYVTGYATSIKQNKPNQWFGNGDIHTYDFTVDDNGNIYVVGKLNGYISFGDIYFDYRENFGFDGTYDGGGVRFLAKLNKNKEREWVKAFEGASFVRGANVEVDSSGYIYMIGSNGSINMNMKFNSNGDIIRSRNEGSSLFADSIHSSCLDDENNLYNLVYKWAGSSYIKKIDTENNISIISKVISGNKSDFVVGADFQTLVVGSILQTEKFGAFTLTSNGLRDGFIGKLDQNNNRVRVKKIGDSGNDNILSVILDSQNNAYVIGSLVGTGNFDEILLPNSSNSGNNMFVAKIDSNGNWLWAKRFLTEEYITSNYIDDIQIRNDNEIYILSRRDSIYFDEDEDDSGYRNTLFLVQMNQSGEIVNMNTFLGESNYGMGSTNPRITINNNEIFLLGSADWTQNLGGTWLENNIGYVYILGYDSTIFNYNTETTLPVGGYTRDVEIEDLSGAIYYSNEESFTITKGVSCDGIDVISQNECNALLKIYTGLNGENWFNKEDWFTNNRPWEGITTDNMQAASISETQEEVSYKIQELELAYYLDLSDNNLSGKITENMFEGLDYNKGRGRFDLSNNNIIEIESGAFQTTEKEYYWCYTYDYDDMGPMYVCDETSDWVEKNTESQVNEDWYEPGYLYIDWCRDGDDTTTNRICLDETDRDNNRWFSSELPTLNYTIMLNLSNNKLKKLNSGSFLGLDYLVSLILSGNRINEIENGTFDNLENITYLDLQYNGLYGLKNSSLFDSIALTGRAPRNYGDFDPTYKNTLRWSKRTITGEILLENNCIDTRVNFTQPYLYCEEYEEEGYCDESSSYWQDYQYFCPIIQYDTTEPTTGDVVGTVLITGGGSWKTDIILYPVISGYFKNGKDSYVNEGFISYDSGLNCMSYRMTGDIQNTCFTSEQSSYYIDFSQTGLFKDTIFSFNTDTDCWVADGGNKCVGGLSISDVDWINPYPGQGLVGNKSVSFYREDYDLDEILEYTGRGALGDFVYGYNFSDWIFTMMPKISYTRSNNGGHDYNMEDYADVEDEWFGMNYGALVLGQKSPIKKPLGLLTFGDNEEDLSFQIQSIDNQLLYTGVEGEVDWIYEPVSIEDMDTEAPVIYGIEDGKTYNGITTLRDVIDNIAVSDVVLDGLDINNRTNLDITETGNHTIIATDTSDNESEISFSIAEETKEASTEEEEETTSGGGGGGSRTPDYCPEGDFSESYYDDICEAAVEEIITGNVCTVAEDTIFGEELVAAFKRAYYLGITTVCPIEDANLEGTLIRKHLAKMISEFAIQVVGEIPEEIESCNNFEDIEGETEEMKEYMILACNLGLMGRESDQKTTKTVFDPNETVNRAQFGTVLSRLLRGDKYAIEDGSIYYQDHLNALKENRIMTIIDPTMEELRGRVMVMMYRVRDFQNK